jgi:flavin reductase (DIM6/NTAB) family NADH-FMN oxidoreductase RutF
MECRLNQVVPIGQGHHQHGLVIGEIVLMHIRDDIISGHRINHHLLKPTGRLAGSMYCHTADAFEMVRPVYQPEPDSRLVR